MRGLLLSLCALTLLHSVAVSQEKDYHYSGQLFQKEAFNGRWIGVAVDSSPSSIRRLTFGDGVNSTPINIAENKVTFIQDGIDFQLYWDESKLYGLSDQEQYWEFYRDTIEKFEPHFRAVNCTENQYGYIQLSGNETTPSLLFDGKTIMPFDLINQSMGISFDGGLLFFVKDEGGELMQIQKDRAYQTIQTFNLLPKYSSTKLSSGNLSDTIYLLDQQTKNTVFIFDSSVLSLPDQTQLILQSLAQARYVNYIWPSGSTDEQWIQSVSEAYAQTIWGDEENQILIGSNLNLSPDTISRFSGIADLDPAVDSRPPFMGTENFTVELGEKEERLQGDTWLRLIIAEPELYFLQPPEHISGTTATAQSINGAVFSTLHQWSRAADPHFEEEDPDDQKEPEPRS